MFSRSKSTLHPHFSSNQVLLYAQVSCNLMLCFKAFSIYFLKLLIKFIVENVKLAVN